MALENEKTSDKSQNPKEGISFWYCINCERTYKNIDKPKIQFDSEIGDLMEMCPYEGCDGTIFMHSKDWDSIRDWHPEYPEIPKPDVIYPLN